MGGEGGKQQSILRSLLTVLWLASRLRKQIFKTKKYIDTIKSLLVISIYLQDQVQFADLKD